MVPQSPITTTRTRRRRSTTKVQRKCRLRSARAVASTSASVFASASASAFASTVTSFSSSFSSSSSSPSFFRPKNIRSPTSFLSRPTLLVVSLVLIVASAIDTPPLAFAIPPITSLTSLTTTTITTISARPSDRKRGSAGNRKASVATMSAAAGAGNRSGSNLRVAIIGAGAAGLTTARQFMRRGITPRIFEKDGCDGDGHGDGDNDSSFPFASTSATTPTPTSTSTSLGGVWKYVPNDRTRPMYRGLRTNLPREIMAFQELPWGGDGGRSYVTHREVLAYLNDYAQKFGLDDLISYGCNVTRLIVKQSDHDHDDENNDDKDGCDPSSWPKIALRWEETNKRDNGQCFEEVFDAVCVCNGHYSSPSDPNIPGLRQHFQGRVMHSIEYDDPSEFNSMAVLCIGARASGSDLAREISDHASVVYVSDSDCPDLSDRGGRPFREGNVLRVPRTVSVTKEGIDGDDNDNDNAGTVAIRFGGGCAVAPTDVDVIILCSGYDYSFPFIDESESDLRDEFRCIPGERRVSPLYEQLWHASVPSLTFVGLPHSVVPFPLFELQGRAVVAQLCGGSAASSLPERLPPKMERMAAARRDMTSGGPKKGGRVQDTHLLGSFQWDYCRRMACLAGVYDDDMEKFIATNKAIYDHSGSERKGLPPGAPDVYRLTSYARDEENKSFKILASEISQVDDSAIAG